jgi:hypothetical protein
MELQFFQLVQYLFLSLKSLVPVIYSFIYYI